MFLRRQKGCFFPTLRIQPPSLVQKTQKSGFCAASRSAWQRIRQYRQSVSLTVKPQQKALQMVQGRGILMAPNSAHRKPGSDLYPCRRLDPSVVQLSSSPSCRESITRARSGSVHVRVLTHTNTPGGTVRVSCPDLTAILRCLQHNFPNGKERKICRAVRQTSAKPVTPAKH